jgi:hypothetical protein
MAIQYRTSGAGSYFWKVMVEDFFAAKGLVWNYHSKVKFYSAFFEIIQRLFSTPSNNRFESTMNMIRLDGCDRVQHIPAWFLTALEFPVFLESRCVPTQHRIHCPFCDDCQLVAQADT